MDVWKDLLPLRLHPDTGPEVITFGVLWELAGGRQRRLDITVKLLTEHFNRDGHTFRDHLEKLFALGCVHLLARDKRRGRFLIHVLHPEFELPFDRTDRRQLKLPLEWEKGVKDIDEYIRRHPEDLTSDASTGRVSSGDLAASHDQSPAEPRKSDDHGEAQSPVYREPQSSGSVGARMAFGAGIFPEPVTGKSPRGNPRGEIPASGRGNPRDETSTAQTACVTGISPSPPVDGVGEIPAGKSPPGDGQYIPRTHTPAPASFIKDSSKEESLLNVSMNNGSKRLNVSTSQCAPVDARRAQTFGSGGDREVAALASIV